ncbi:hypothetical protein GCM10009715_39430 [Paeniglutamicibacter psychrophenolicus]|uniref:DUF4352 domain-containing protein n=1 Tax=Paeniglutamicibacter psychrophenolicus TaxID=257454 RepID=A0ABS4WIK0_9MICC|nr:DUF4352 domain-containing protein [Paeniglutamicibacter psychrophenolicus]MBP2376039.1 hypothetical protein [Paeniglutamicibacter psychrophenolicus]
MTEHNGFPAGDPIRGAKAQAKADKAYKKAMRPWFKKKRVILPLALVAVIGIANLANGGGDKETDANGSSVGSTVQQAEAATPSKKTEDAAPSKKAEKKAPAFPGAEESDVIGNAGAALKMGDITVTSAALEQGKSILGATLCTAVSVKNGSDETIDFNSMDWKLQSPGGTIKNITFGGSDDTIGGGEIAPGGSTKGDVCFEAKNEKGQYIVLYEPVFKFFSDRAAWINK